MFEFQEYFLRENTNMHGRDIFFNVQMFCFISIKLPEMFRYLNVNVKESGQENVWYTSNTAVLKNKENIKENTIIWLSIWEEEYSTNGAILKT